MDLHPLLSLWISTFGVVFAIIDPFGYIPVFMSMTARNSPDERKQMLIRACVTAFLVLAFFTFLGNFILRFFGISIPALQISGGLILLTIGYEMLKVLKVNEKLSPGEETEGVEKDDISIIPLAIPMLSGPASIATVVVLSSKVTSPVAYLPILFSIFGTLAFTYIILQSAGRIFRFVGLTGLNVMTRVMGFLLCAMGIQFMINGYQAVR